MESNNPKLSRQLPVFVGGIGDLLLPIFSRRLFGRLYTASRIGSLFRNDFQGISADVIPWSRRLGLLPMFLPQFLVSFIVTYD